MTSGTLEDGMGSVMSSCKANLHSAVSKAFAANTSALGCTTQSRNHRMKPSAAIRCFGSATHMQNTWQ